MLRHILLSGVVPTGAFRSRFSPALSLVRGLCDTAASDAAGGGGAEYVQSRSEEQVGFVEIHRVRDMNKLSVQVLGEVADALEGHDVDPSVHVIVLHGSERVFAAGGDIAELAAQSAHSVRYRSDPWQALDRVAAVRKPMIAAVSGFALGVGCELAMSADIVIAAEDAVFGQPEVQLATLPGAGGTQRLTRAVGKAKAMEMILTGRHMDAEEAERAGLVSRVAKKGEALSEAIDTAKVIAKHSLPVTTTAKECVNAAHDMNIANGLKFERRAAQAVFSTDDCKEGLKAFLDERKPSYKNR